jgi:hypothetical protein
MTVAVRTTTPRRIDELPRYRYATARCGCERRQEQLVGAYAAQTWRDWPRRLANRDPQHDVDEVNP